MSILSITRQLAAFAGTVNDTIRTTSRFAHAQASTAPAASLA